jgi:hypothetical protein
VIHILGQKTLNSKLWAIWERTPELSQLEADGARLQKSKGLVYKKVLPVGSRNMICPSLHAFKIALKRTHLCLCWHCDQLITLWSRLLQFQGPVEEAGCIRPGLFYNSISANGYECSQWHTKNTKFFQFCWELSKLDKQQRSVTKKKSQSLWFLGLKQTCLVISFHPHPAMLVHLHLPTKLKVQNHHPICLIATKIKH